MTWIERIVSAHVAVTSSVSHATRLRSDRYFVWMEDGTNTLAASGGHPERAMTGRTDLYTKQEFDPWAEALELSFDRHAIAWSLVSVEYEAETGFFHYSWDWECS